MFSKFKQIRRGLKAARRRKQVAVWIVSVPKSGRTWLRSTIGTYLCIMSGVEKSEALDLAKLCVKLKLPIIELTHGSSDFGKYANASDVEVPDFELWAGKKVIFITRDVKDVLVSAFHHMKYRTEEFDGDISEFIRTDRFGVERISSSLNNWTTSRNTASSSIDVTYEAMHEDAEAVLISILKFCSFPIDLDCVRDAVEFNQFENMKRLEQKKFFSHASMRPMKSAKPEGRKTREGKSGQYMKYLSQSDIEYIDHVMGENNLK